MAKQPIPYKIYLSEEEIPRRWYNLNAAMQYKHEPFLNPATLQPCKPEELKQVFCSDCVDQELNRTDGITVVVTLHQVDYAIQYCPRTVALKKGRIVYDGPTANLTRAMLKTLYGSESDDLFGKKEEAPTIAQGAAA